MGFLLRLSGPVVSGSSWFRKRPQKFGQPCRRSPHRGSAARCCARPGGSCSPAWPPVRVRHRPLFIQRVVVYRSARGHDRVGLVRGNRRLGGLVLRGLAPSHDTTLATWSVQEVSFCSASSVCRGVAGTTVSRGRAWARERRPPAHEGARRTLCGPSDGHGGRRLERYETPRRAYRPGGVMGTRWKLDPVGRFVQRRESQVVGGAEGDVGRETGLVTASAGAAGRDPVGPRSDERQKSWVTIDLSGFSDNLHLKRRASAGYDGRGRHAGHSPRAPRLRLHTTPRREFRSACPAPIRSGLARGSGGPPGGTDFA